MKSITSFFILLLSLAALIIAGCSTSQPAPDDVMEDKASGDAMKNEVMTDKADNGDVMESDGSDKDAGSGDAMESTTHTVEITNNGYNPSTLTVKQGDTVTFLNTGSQANWPATDIHPTHKVYPGSEISKCGTGADIFDACGGVSEGDSYSFTFNEIGAWRYHNHRRSSQKGTIVVE